MKIEKQFTINAPQEDVWKFITDPEKVGPCISGCHEVAITGPSTYKAAIRVQVGPIKTTFNVNIEATEERPPEYSAYITKGEEGGKASRMKAESTLSLTAVDAKQTEVIYTSDINIVGRLGKFGLGIMKKKADSMGDEFVAAVRSQIEGTSEVAAEETGTNLFSGHTMLWAGGIGVLILVLLFVLTQWG